MITLNLVPYRTRFLQPFLEWRREAATIRHNPLLEMPPAEVESMLASEGSDLSDLRKHSGYRWFIEFEGIVVGNVSLKNISRMMQYGEIGYGVAEAYQRRGIATAAVRLLSERVFLDSTLRKLVAYVHD